MTRLIAVFILIVNFSGSSWAQSSDSSTAQAPAAATPSAANGSDEASTAKDATYLICKNKAVVRTLRVSKKSNGGCLATYTKDGVDQVVGQSWATERCSKVIGNIRENLEKAHWKCKDISEARVSSSEG
jgi:hypothetical protein